MLADAFSHCAAVVHIYMYVVQAAGADGKMDKPEFVNLFKHLLNKIRGNPAPVAEAAAAAGYQA